MGLRTRTVDVTVVVVAAILGVLNARRALLPTAATSRPPSLSLAQLRHAALALALALAATLLALR